MQQLLDSESIKTIVLGQVMSLCLCGTAISSQFLSNNGFIFSTAQSLPTYFTLLVFYTIILLQKQDGTYILGVLRDRGWKYFLLSFIDVEANFAIVYAYQFTNITSIQLLDCFTIPTVMLISFIFLSARYNRHHLVGVAICLIGIAVCIFADIQRKNGLEGGSNKLFGDALCFIATILYAIANVSEEYLIKENTRSEYLCIVGIFGFFISSIQVLLLEADHLSTFVWNRGVWQMLMLFTLSMVVFYSLVSIVMERSSALMFNISILTADFYSLLASIVVFGEQFNFLYFVSFAVIMVGTLLYNKTSPITNPLERSSSPDTS